MIRMIRITTIPGGHREPIQSLYYERGNASATVRGGGHVSEEIAVRQGVVSDLRERAARMPDGAKRDAALSNLTLHERNLQLLVDVANGAEIVEATS